LTDFHVGDIVRLKKDAFVYHDCVDINKFHYLILARNNRVNYNVLHVHSLIKHYGVSMDEYELA